jgi:hypothetical protein
VVYPKSRVSQDECQVIDIIVNFLYRINYQDWLPEDSEVVENLEPKYSLFLLDNTNCLRLMKCAYFDDYAAALYRDGTKYEIGLMESDIPYFNFCRRPEWLAACAALVLRNFSQFQNSPIVPEWRVRNYGVYGGRRVRQIPLCTVFDILAALAHFIDTVISENSCLEQANCDLSQNITLFYGNVAGNKKHINNCFGVNDPIWDDEIRCPSLRDTDFKLSHLLPLLDSWSIPLIHSLAGVHFYTRSCQLPDLPFPKKVPDRTALGLLKDVGPAKTISDIHITELAADRIIRARPYKFAITRSIERHLLVDGYTIYIFCEEESVAYPGHSFSVFKGNRMAR